MSKAKFAAVKELIDEKKYNEARKLLKTIDHPTARAWEEKLNKIAPESPVATYRWAFVAGALGLVGIIAVILIVQGLNSNPAAQLPTVAPSSPPDVTQVALPTVESASDANSTPTLVVDDKMIAVDAALQVYCTTTGERAKGDCSRWSVEVIVGNYEGAEICYDEYDWITDTYNFTLCLMTQGIVAVGNYAIVTPFQDSEWSEEGFEIIGLLVAYCGRDGDESYCLAWAATEFREHSATIQQCYDVTRTSDFAVTDFWECLENQDITA